ncbi:hypothetical protein EDD66_103240 [Mobilisporobacter senegalensis]|uniref:Uncharacterized protein n=1 Tax=Mobilisporobacter senegalensis TaxID=1329262 RepID=A0A3N1XRL3_9FIRM|nr:hypothetical protein [Mobilisporobacter senegalensis]ROR29304.1 hypothetical protein EDD66_103240 [Mobilisporobacter senegalensis]
MIKKIIKSFTFWFVIISLLMIYMHYEGRDSKSIVLIYFNPILLRLSRMDFTRDFMNSGPLIACNTILGNISIYWYIGHIISAIIYGGIFDAFRWIFIKLKSNHISRTED